MKKKKKALKRSFRVFMTSVIFFLIMGFISYNSFIMLMQINDKKNEEKLLKQKIMKLETKEKELKDNVDKLKDPDYAARYAREKYLYSKDGEIIIKIN